ncbi:MAG TPA: copper chaperone PCu(A)C [Woeseiaceae bacterium]|nr:copper chaperone PCu(A)C [Woeseiaceae bacterium]
MNGVRFIAASTACLVAACGSDPLPLSASGVTILAPLPGQQAAVAYLSLDNHGVAPITLTRITSPQFESVAMHATIVDEGVAGMQSLDSITIAENSRIVFDVGGRHLMLLSPRETLRAGDEVTLEFHYDETGVLQLNAQLQSRGAGTGEH